MPHDDILAEIGADWKRQTVDTDRLQRRVQRRQRRGRLFVAMKVAGALCALLLGCWFVGLALTGEGPIFAFAGGVLLVALPVMVREAIDTQRLTAITTYGSPERTLQTARDQAVAIERLLWAPRAAALLLTVSALGMIALYALDMASLRETAAVAAVWILTAIIAWWWQARRAARLEAEIACCDHLLAELSRAEAE